MLNAITEVSIYAPGEVEKEEKWHLSQSERSGKVFLEEGAPVMKQERQVGVGFMKREDSFYAEGHRGNPGGLR